MYFSSWFESKYLISFFLSHKNWIFSFVTSFCTVPDLSNVLLPCWGIFSVLILISGTFNLVLFCVPCSQKILYAELWPGLKCTLYSAPGLTEKIQTYLSDKQSWQKKIQRFFFLDAFCHQSKFQIWKISKNSQFLHPSWFISEIKILGSVPNDFEAFWGYRTNDFRSNGWISYNECGIFVLEVFTISGLMDEA